MNMVQSKEHLYTQVEEDGRVILPPELLSRYGIKAGARIRVDEDANGFKLVHPTRLAKLYIEATNECNLNCRICVRNVWQEPMGKMSDITFDRVIDGLRDDAVEHAVAAARTIAERLVLQACRSREHFLHGRCSHSHLLRDKIPLTINLVLCYSIALFSGHAGPALRRGSSVGRAEA